MGQAFYLCAKPAHLIVLFVHLESFSILSLHYMSSFSILWLTEIYD